MQRDSFFVLFGLSKDAYSWRGLSYFIWVYIGAFLLGGILAWPIHSLIILLAEGSSEGSVLYYLANKELDDYVDRIRLLAAAASLFWLISVCQLWGNFGFNWGLSGILTLLKWMLGGVLSLGIVVLLQILFLPVELTIEVFRFEILEVLLASLIGGLLLGWLEEAIFRGMVFRMFYSAVRPEFAVFLGALIFAMTHFKSVDGVSEMGHHWHTGLVIAWESFLSVIYTFQWDAFMNYFLAGIVLCLVFLKTRSLVACMGMHAGWILVRNTWMEVANVGDPSTPSFLLGDQHIINGLFSVLLLIGISAWLYVAYRSKIEEQSVC